MVSEFVDPYKTKVRESVSLAGRRSNFVPEPHNALNYTPYLVPIKNREIVTPFFVYKPQPLLPISHVISHNGSATAELLRSEFAFPPKNEGFLEWIRLQKEYTGRVFHGGLYPDGVYGLITEEDQDLLHGYTLFGDVLVNSYLRGTLIAPFKPSPGVITKQKALRK